MPTSPTHAPPRLSGKQGDPACQIDEDLVGADYVPLESAPFLQYLNSAISESFKGAKTTTPAQAGVRVCGLQEVQSGTMCPPISPKECTLLGLRGLFEYMIEMQRDNSDAC